MPASCFILENDIEIRENLLRVLNEFPEFRRIESCPDYERGMNMILKSSPRVVFINVDMGLESYPDVFAYCKEINEHLDEKPLYIAISSDERKAYQAFKNKFFDYLLKPGRELEIRKIILQILKRANSSATELIDRKSTR